MVRDVESYIARRKLDKKFHPLKWKSITGKVDTICYKQDKDDVKNKEQIVQFVTSQMQPEHKFIGSMNDINRELAALNVEQDSIRKNARYRIAMQLKLIRTFEDNPDLDDRDHIRSKMVNKGEITIPEIKLREINKKYEKEGKRKLKDFKKISYDDKMPSGQKKRYTLIAGDTVDHFKGQLSHNTKNRD